MKVGEIFEAYFTPSPNLTVLRSSEPGVNQHVVVTARTGQVHDFMLEDAAQVALLCMTYEKETKSFVRLRHYWGDNSHGNGVASVQVIVDKGDKKAFSPERLKWPTTTKNGQSLDVQVRVVEANVGSDRFEANAEEFYELGEYPVFNFHGGSRG